VARYRESLTKRWGVDLQLILCPRQELGEKASKWSRYGAGVSNFFKQGIYRFGSGRGQLEALETALQWKPDAIFAHRLAAMCPLLLTETKLPRILFDLDDVEHVAQLRVARQSTSLRDKLLSYLYVPVLSLGERRAIQRANETFVCSHSDRRYLSVKWRLPRISVIPNAIPIAQAQEIPQEPTILFLGNFGYDPNVQAARYLINKIWPRIRRVSPKAQLIIAGDCPNRIGYSQNDGSGIELTGFADDLNALYRRSRVIAVPIFAGSGTRIKIIEAAAYGKPIVATSVGAEGLEMRDGHELLIRNTPDAFAAACIQLLEDTELCRQLGHAGRIAASEHYDRSNVVRQIQGRIRNAVGK
jgi:glycosyltransferase involved in cell wall biosynthesis